MDVGFVGLGIMGAPMARNLLRAGNTLFVHNRSAAKAAPLAQAGATVLDSPAEVAERVEALFTCLSDSPDVEAAYLGEGGILSRARAGQVFVDTSTIAPDVARKVAAAAADRGAAALDAPVSGGDVGAREGTLSVMV
ncbi:MAG: NAD(P)-dependent oxidoreductase, partial [Solirubrobacteraceae bacterium]